MDLVTLPFSLPLLPLKGLIRLAELIQEEAEGQYHDPADVRRELEDLEDAHSRGEISSEELYQAEIEAVERVVPTAAAATGRAGQADADAGEADADEQPSADIRLEPGEYTATETHAAAEDASAEEE